MTNQRVISDEKRHGQHYTPTALAQFLATKSLNTVRTGGDELTIVDPACGDGELLIAAAAAAAARGHTGKVNLIGYDIDERAIDVAKSRMVLAGLSGDFHHSNFLVSQRTLASESVDLIITNPPYVRTQHLGQEAAQLLSAEFGLTGRVDLTHPFVTVASRLLKRGGTLGLLCSNRFLTTLSGENVRRTLMNDGLQVRELYDLGDTKLFAAAVLPAVIIATKTEATDQPARFVSAYESTVARDGSARPLFTALEGAESGTALHNGKLYEVKVGTFVPPLDTKTPWRLSAPDSDFWLDQIKKGTWRTFGDIAKIRVGIKSTADKVFIRDDWDTIAPGIENELLLPLITQSNITPWRIADELGMRVLYPYDMGLDRRKVLNIDDWPGAGDYLTSHEEQLRGRRYVVEGGREWYEIWVPQRPALWAKPKIVFPDISEHPRFALDTTGAVVNGNCYWISLDDIEDEEIAFLMLAVANSALGVRFYDEACGNKLYSGKRRWITQYVKRLPLPDPTTPEAKRLIADARSLVAANAISQKQMAQLNRDVEAAFEASVRDARPAQPKEFSATLF